MIDKGRVVHIKKEPYDVRIDRLTVWGNPFVIGRDGDRDEVLAKFLHWVITSEDYSADWIRENVHVLYGKTLGCWCAPQPCHGEILLALAVQALYGDMTELYGEMTDPENET